DETRTREIQMNATESRTRDALLHELREPDAMRRNLTLIELIDAYETAGNQLYRLAETLGAGT
ncbi:MAG TPA: hypothetical protein VHZ95_07395, partial [Polyangiales bacterium]|nr:hypothetical protein [Polyangiales bacterium]